MLEEIRTLQCFMTLDEETNTILYTGFKQVCGSNPYVKMKASYLKNLYARKYSSLMV